MLYLDCHSYALENVMYSFLFHHACLWIFHDFIFSIQKITVGPILVIYSFSNINQGMISKLSFNLFGHQETFEFLNVMQVHGFPRVMGVLTHLDKFNDVKKLRKTKQRLKHRFWTEIYNGAKLFYLSGLIHGK